MLKPTFEIGLQDKSGTKEIHKGINTSHHINLIKVVIL